MATQIPIFPVSQLTLGAHCNFHTSSVNNIAATGAESLNVKDLYELYKTAVETEATIVNRQTTFVATEAMKQADKMRDDMLAVINGVISAHQYTHIESKFESYMALSSAYAPYRNIRAHEYSRQTAEVAGLLAALNTEANLAHVQNLALTDEVAKLSAANASFGIELDKKTAEMASRIPEKEISSEEARIECDRLYAQIIAIVNAYALIQPTEAITGYVTMQTGIVETYRLIAGNTGKSRKEEEPTASTETDETEETTQTEETVPAE